MLASRLLPLAAIDTWLTPIWLLSVGVACGLAVLGLVYGLLLLIAPARVRYLPESIGEGPLLPVFYLSVVLTGVALLGTALVPARSLINAVSRIAATGTTNQTIDVPAATRDFRLPQWFRPLELQAFTIRTDKPLIVTTEVSRRAGQNGTVKMPAGGEFSWQKQGPTEKVFPTPDVQWTASNLGTEPARLTAEIKTDIEYPEVRIVPWTALALVLLTVGYFAFGLIFPRVAAIALATSKECASQPVYYVLMGLGTFLLLLFVFIPYNTFGEDVKMLRDSTLSLIMVFSIGAAVWFASVSVADEIEGRTALTVLSKPVSRLQFILGKFVGVLCPVALMYILLGFLFMATVSYKVVYDAREVASSAPSWQSCHAEMVLVLPGLVLSFMQTITLAAISIAISTRLPMLANLIICAAIFVLGNLTPKLVESSQGQFEIVQFVGQLISVVLPVLDHFNIQAAVAAGKPVPGDYLAWSGLYCALYVTVALLAALWLFEDRDLA